MNSCMYMPNAICKHKKSKFGAPQAEFFSLTNYKASYICPILYVDIINKVSQKSLPMWI